MTGPDGPAGTGAQVDDVPAWLRPVTDALGDLRAEHLTGFAPPPGARPRAGAVLMAFAAGERGPELLLTERAHHMRSHPGQVSFPGGKVEPGETHEQAALREAWEEIGLEPSSVRVVGRLPELWLPPSNFAVVPVVAWWTEHAERPVSVVSPDEVHAIHRVAVADLVDPTWRRTVRGPSGWSSPGFLIGPDHDVVLWGFTGGIVARLLDFIGWAEPWDESRTTELPPYMLGGAERAGPLRPGDSRGAAPVEPPMADIEEDDA
ncbi:CoA pyrophosphatase [Nocardioides zeae]|uniref:CoA pyrophosphatase n=1 Tax=Nocardioides imazamoxiresistens TaxID=3231893 RepID=A0ABU3Q043_9ACTN|nr:CoA pyrophosphatase [Nocardioides zeae]MDT9594739.1 CoA pyrophosphatase [Nocardioides zeae]